MQYMVIRESDEHHQTITTHVSSEESKDYRMTRWSQNWVVPVKGATRFDLMQVDGSYKVSERR